MLTTFNSLLFNVFMYQDITTDSVLWKHNASVKKQTNKQILENKKK